MRHTCFCITSSNTQRQSGAGAAPGQSQTSAEHVRRQAQPSALLPVSAGELEEHGVSASLRFLRSSVSPKRPSTEEWIEDAVYIYIVEYYSDRKRGNLMVPLQPLGWT